MATSDIETSINSEFNSNYNSTYNTFPTIQIKYTSDSESGLCLWGFKLCIYLIIIFIMFIIFPFAFCDLYWAYRDNSCVHNLAGKLSINLYDYLLVSGWMSIGIILMLILGILCMSPIIMFSFGIIGMFIALFSFCWNIIGGVIFWAYMDNSTCSSSVFNYVFASLIIKYVFMLFSLCLSKNIKNK